MYKLMVRHYGEAVDTISKHTTKAEAEHALLLQSEILKGYFKRTMMYDGQFICLPDNDDYWATRLWVEADRTMVHRVIWKNVWNYRQEEGGTSRIHLASSGARVGTTLCGREYPEEKGWPVAVRYCKVCLKKAKSQGVTEFKDLPWIPYGNA